MDRSLRHGRVAGLLTVAGNSTALAFWALALALGLTALIHASEIAFTALKFAGAAYLCWLGARSVWRAHRPQYPAESPLPTAERSRDVWGAAFGAGLLTNLTNPKAAVLYLALLPQFLPSAAELSDILTLAGTQITISAGWYVVVVFAASSVRRVIARPLVRKWLDRMLGSVLIALGIKTATLAR